MEALRSALRRSDIFNKINKSIKKNKLPLYIWGLTRAAQPLLEDELRRFNDTVSAKRKHSDRVIRHQSAEQEHPAEFLSS